MAVAQAQFTKIERPPVGPPVIHVAPVETPTGTKASSFTPSPLPHVATLKERETLFPSVETKFHALATAWRWHNRGKSVLDYDDFSYLQIIGMGPPVVPSLLKAVEEGEGFWYFALKCITSREAETPNMHGDPEAIRQAWIEWGKKHGQLAIRG
jgi:hypothetical protein